MYYIIGALVGVGFIVVLLSFFIYCKKKKMKKSTYTGSGMNGVTMKNLEVNGAFDNGYTADNE